MTAFPESPILPTPRQRRGMRDAIICQSLGVLPFLAFSYGMMLLYLKVLGFTGDHIVFFLALMILIDAVTRIPWAFLGDRFGKWAVAMIGAVMEMAGLAVLAVAPSFPDAWVTPVLYVGVVISAAGTSAFGATWFALLSPIVPEAMRGRFFGRLRVIWQTVGIIFFLLCTPLFKTDTPVSRFQWVFAIGVAAMVIRLLYVARLPEMERGRLARGHSVVAVALDILRAPGYASFSCYWFLLALVTAYSATLFNLIEKEILGWGDDRIIVMGVLMMIGSVCGYFVGGKAVDRWGTKPVFLICHLGYALVLVLFLLRPTGLPLKSLTIVVGSLHLGFGFVQAASSIALSTEMLALIPADNKSISTSICQTLGRGGAALSGLFCSALLGMGMLNEQWTLGQRVLTKYDTILLGCALLILLFVVTLGLVPSVLRKSEWVPRAMG